MNPNGGPAQYRFKPGQSGNPGGRPKAKITIDLLKEIVEKLFLMNREQLQQVITDAKTTTIELQFVSIMARAAKDGDYSRLSFILDRIIGKPKLPEEITEEEKMRAEVKKMTREQLIELVKDDLGKAG